MGRRGERVVDDEREEVEVVAEELVEEVKVKSEEPDEEVQIIGSKKPTTILSNEVVSLIGSRPAPPAMTQPNGSSSGLAIDVDVDAVRGMAMNMDIDLPSLDEMIVVGLDHRTSVASGSSRRPESEDKLADHVNVTTPEHTNSDLQTEPRHPCRRPRRHHMVRYQRTLGPPVPITKEYIKALRDIFIPPRPPPVNNEVEPEESGFSNMRNQQELICPNGLCRQYGCLLHGESPGKSSSGGESN